MEPRSTTLEHVGEWKVSVEADTLEAVFIELARVIARSVGEGSSAAGEWEPVVVAARDPATLLVDWANEMLGRSEVTGRAYSEARRVRIRELADSSHQFSAEVRGPAVDTWTSPLKAATYHGLSLRKVGGRWHAVILFDV